MRVLQINSFCGSGSTGRIAADLSRGLREAGHDCLIAYGRDTVLTEIKSLRIGTKADNYVHALNTRLFDNQGFCSVKATKQLIRQIRSYDPDIIHLHNLHGYYLNIEILFDYLRSAQKPIVWTLHDCWAFTGHCAYFDYAGCNKWKTECNRCPQKNRYPASILVDRSHKNYALKKSLFTSVDHMTIVTPSRWLAGLVGQSFLFRYPVKVIPNGIDLQSFQPTAGNFRAGHHLEDKFIVLGVANVWEKRKGLNYLAELAGVLGENYKIVVVGVTEKQKRHFPGSVLCIPRTNFIKELAGIYTAADVFVNPTMEDNFPTTNLEALACGTPVITFDTGGSPEAIDESCGIVVDRGNLEKLKSAIEWLRQNKISSECCRKRAEQFSSVKSYNEYLQLYDYLSN